MIFPYIASKLIKLRCPVRTAQFFCNIILFDFNNFHITKKTNFANLKKPIAKYKKSVIIKSVKKTYRGENFCGKVRRPAEKEEKNEKILEQAERFADCGSDAVLAGCMRR